MKKEALKITITDEQAMRVHIIRLQQQAQENNTTAPIPPFESIKDKLKTSND